jgi:hypothetical protein
LPGQFRRSTQTRTTIVEPRSIQTVDTGESGALKDLLSPRAAEVNSTVAAAAALIELIIYATN